MHRSRLAPALLALVAAASLAACAWSVPADPGLVAACRPCKPGRPRPRASATATAPARTPEAGTPPPSPGEDEGARDLYVARCSRCHEAFPPTHATAAQWPVFVRKYGPRAGLFGADRERALAWLQARAR